MDEVCGECGSKLDYRQVDVTTFDSVGKEYESLAWRCNNPACRNHNPSNLTFEWAIPKAEWDANHRA